MITNKLGARASLVICMLTVLGVAPVEAAVPGNVFDNLPLPGWMADGLDLIWKLPLREYAVGVVFGLALALLSVYKFIKIRSTSTAPITGNANSFSRYGRARALLLNGFIWVYVTLIVGFAGLVYTGFFAFAKDKIDETMPTWVSWGPAGASVLATFCLTLLSRRFSWITAQGGVQLEEVIEDLEEQSTTKKQHWLSTLAWSRLEEARQAEVTNLAYAYSVGIIKHAMKIHCETEVDRGRVASDDTGELLTELGEIAPGKNARERFTNRRHAIAVASRIVPLEELEQTINDNDRRKADRRHKRGKRLRGKERRNSPERRVDRPLVRVAS